MSIALTIAIAWGVAAPLAVAYHFRRKNTSITAKLREAEEAFAQIKDELSKGRGGNLFALYASDERMLEIHRAMGRIYNWPEEVVDPAENEGKVEEAFDEAIDAGADEQVVELFRTLRKIKEPSEEAIQILDQMKVKDKEAIARSLAIGGPDALIEEWSINMRAVDATAPKVEEELSKERPPKED